MSKANGVRCTNHFRVEVPVASWGKPFSCPHGLNDGRGSGYTPHQAFVTAAYVGISTVESGTNNTSKTKYHPIETGTAHVIDMDAAKLTLLVGPACDTSAATSELAEALSQKNLGLIRSMLVEVYARFVTSYELGTVVTADATQQEIPCGVPVSLSRD